MSDRTPGHDPNHPLLIAAAPKRRNLLEECREGCDCTWCRCKREIEASEIEDEELGS